MNIIKCKCVDEGPWWKSWWIPYANLIEKHYKIEISDNPDILFYSCFGSEFMKYDNCIRIFYTEENVRPDFNFCDYAIGFDRMQFGNRYIRKKIYTSSPCLEPGKRYFDRKFCNFIYSNFNDGDNTKNRIVFYNMLSKYKHIDAPGKVCNNMQNAISPRAGNFSQGKLDFISDYKFTIAFENCIYPGYVTEKLFHPFQANSVPIYLGDPDITLDFNEKSFVNVNAFPNFEACIEYIKYLDNNEKAYMEVLSENPMVHLDTTDSKLETFLINIIENGIKYHKNSRYSRFSQPFKNQSIILDKINSNKKNDSINDLLEINLNDLQFCNTYKLLNILGNY